LKRAHTAARIEMPASPGTSHVALNADPLQQLPLTVRRFVDERLIDVRPFRIYAGTRQIRQLIIARNVIRAAS
jgi:alkylation response protein AidB-like acyl-CoA dehydrogenase